ncbi:mediator of RNA polymerase II transcription subunit 12 [Vigna unguiculata]|uniref:Mediator of RNA polymerase II transcription subunit 12 n=1 Tax=Vigna unguiculata TaxID=3917 RepID=A0A4D6MKT4_VIGUN|nr:mediator of RNA polymerase II transcription subunit 12 [Vigna unguiculata]
MQRYHAGSCTSAVNNSAIGGPSARDTGRSDSPSLPANFSVSSRRQPPLNPFKLKCDKEPLNSRLGAPDFHPQTSNCPEETLTREYLQSGYRDTVEGLEEAREISLTQVPHFNKNVVLNCKEAIRKRLRAINESRAQKRKAGQVYGVALSGSQLARSGIFPELRPCGEDFQKKWIEGLSQQHKRLRSLADHVPHGYKRASLLDVLIRNNVPLLRATWFIKVTYLNQVQPGSVGISSGTADKIQLSRSDVWTKDVINYLQALLDEFLSKNVSHSASHGRERSPQIPGPLQNKSDPLLSVSDGEGPSLHFRWWYIVRLLQWHHAEGLLHPSLVIDWVFTQLQEKDLLEVWQLLLPIIYGFLETIVLSQTYVRTLAGLALRVIRDPAPGGSDLVDNSRRAYTTCAVIEMLRYLILVVPDTFVALDCFPLPSSVISHTMNDGNFVLKSTEAAGKVKNSSDDFGRIISRIQKHTEDLVKASIPGSPGHCLAKVAKALDKALVLGDLHVAYKFLFDDLCGGTVSEGWVAKVSPCLRDFRGSPPHDIKFTGRKDLSQVHIAVRLLKMKIKDVKILLKQTNEYRRASRFAKNLGQRPNSNYVGKVSRLKSSSKSTGSSVIFESPGPLHDIIVCWIDQHVVHKGEGSKRLQLFIVELIRAGIFYPLAYVRQLIVSGIMDANVNLVDMERRRRHYRILKQLPGCFIHDVLEDLGIVDGVHLKEALQIYLNERRLILRGPLSESHDDASGTDLSALKRKRYPASIKDEASGMTVDQRNVISTTKNVKDNANIEELKTAISVLLQLPNCSSNLSATGCDESEGTIKRSIGSQNSKIDPVEGTPGCEQCSRTKRQKLSEERNSCVQGHSPVQSDDDDAWWVKKGMKSPEPLKVDQPQKLTKQVTKSRQKNVRKTQSLAQLAASRIEGSQGASTSHVCGSKVSCPHHKTAMDVDGQRSVDIIPTSHFGDIVSIGKALKQLRFVEKRAIAVWLLSVVRQVIEETDKNIGKVGQFGRPFSGADDRSSIRWKLGEDELSAILYLMDISHDLVSAVKFLLWLLPRVLNSPNSTIHSGRNVLMLARNAENQVCDVGEAILLSSLRRYENILVAADLIPEALSSAMHRAAKIVSSNGRLSGSGVLAFARYLLRKYSNVASVIEWEKTFKATCDTRLSSELDSCRSVDGELGLPLGVPAGVEDHDDFFRQKISGGRLQSRVGAGMREVVQRNVEEAFHFLFGKDRKLFAAGTLKGLPPVEKWDNGYQIAQQIVMGLIDCIRQTGGAAQEGDPSLVSSAVSAIVGSVGPTLAKMPDFSSGSNHSNITSTSNLLNYARCILRMHITCLGLLKEALGERQSRVFDIALATEASTALAGVFTPSKASRAQFQTFPEVHDSSNTISNDMGSNSNKVVVAKTTKIAAAVSALFVGAIIYGVTSLERMVTVLRLKEGLDAVQFVRSTRSNANGNARSVMAFNKMDSSIEVHVHWFRLLVGNCRTICEGLVVELLGEPFIMALSRMQRMLPLNLVFPPAYSIFAFIRWRPFILNATVREDMNQIYQSLIVAITEAIKHLPFRDVCFRDCQGLYDLMSADNSDSEFANLLEFNGSDMHLKLTAFVPLRSRLFLNAIIDCKMPQSIYAKDDGSRISGPGESKVKPTDSGSKLQDMLVHVLDTLQPAKFHWQWVLLRLLLNEQALIEKVENHDVPLSDAIKLSSPSPEKAASASENENNFIQILLTRLLVRPDAAPLFSELIHLFGRSLEDSMLLQAKWFLGGQDVLFGRKAIRQRLHNIAVNKKLSVKTQFWEPWGWCSPTTDSLTIKGDNKKFDSTSLEEGEVVEEGTYLKRCQQQVIERALIELLLPCIDQSSDEARNSFATDLVKQLSYIETHITAITGGSKPVGSAPAGVEGQPNKVNNRKNLRTGNATLSRRPTVATDSSPPSPAALRASMSLRLQLLLRFLPTLCTDREPSVRSTRQFLASVIFRLLGSRVVHQDADISANAVPLPTREAESSSEVASAAFVDSSSQSLFDRLLLVLHGLLSSYPPSWLRPKPSKTSNEPTIDRELLETLQNDLDRMQLPDTVRWRIQAAMPVLIPSMRCSLSCQPPSVSNSALMCIQPGTTNPGVNSSSSTIPQRGPALSRVASNVSGKQKRQDNDLEIDPWTLLEDGAGSVPPAGNTASIGSGDHVNIRAASWLKGAVRVRRTDLTYVGAVDDDS